MPIRDCGYGRFDFGTVGSDPLGLVVEAIGEDGETPDDLIAWPVNDPATVLSMHGRVGILGLWHAFNPATYLMGKPLAAHPARRSNTCRPDAMGQRLSIPCLRPGK